MSIEERTSGSVTVLDVAGRMTIETVGDMPLLARVRRLLQGGRTHVVLNLAGVPMSTPRELLILSRRTSPRKDKAAR